MSERERNVAPSASSEGRILGVIVDLAVHDQLAAAVGRGHRLASRVGEIDDGEPRVGEDDARVVIDAASVGTAMTKGPREKRSPRGVGRALRERVDAGNPAHQARECSTVA